MRHNISHPSTDLLSEAAHWYNERLSGDMTTSHEQLFDQWIGRSPVHRKAYEAIDQAWCVAGAVGPSQPVLEQPDVPTKKPRWSILAAMAASLLLGISISQGAWPLLGASEEVRTVQAFVTATGQRSVITLPDGTRVTMDSETDIRFSDLTSERSVNLIKGRAYFDVAKNFERPFVVYVGGKTVRALGTIFEVSMNGDQISVVLAEGRVRVEDVKRRGSAELAPGRQLVMREDKHWTLRNVDVGKETSWIDGRLIFMSDPLSQAVAEINRYSNRKIVFEGDIIAEKEIVGVFSAGDVESFVKALEINGIARLVSSNPDRIVLKFDEESEKENLKK